MEYIVIGLLVIVIGLLWFKDPSKMKNIVTDSVLEQIKTNQKSIADGVYAKLPEEAKKDLPEATVKAGIENMVGLAVEVIEEGLK